MLEQSCRGFVRLVSLRGVKTSVLFWEEVPGCWKWRLVEPLWVAEDRKVGTVSSILKGRKKE